MSEGGSADDQARRIANDVFLQVEHWLYLVLGLILSLTALLALGGAAVQLWHGLADWTGAESTFTVIDRLLFVLMLVEILHTVRVSVRSGALTPEPFLIVGLIASIRRVLVITLESSKVTQSGHELTEGHERLFHASMIELGVLCVLILVMVASIFLLRHTARDGDRPVSTDHPA